MWPFRRRARGADEVPPGDAGPVLRAPRQDWKGLAPMPVQSRPLATLDTAFEQRLTTRQAPTFLGPLGHHLAPEAPHGRVAAAPATRQPVTFPAAPPVPRQRLTSAGPPATPSPPTVGVSSTPAGPAVPVTPADVAVTPADVTAAGEPGPRPPDGPVVVPAAPMVSRLVTAPSPPNLPAAPFPVVSRLPVDDAAPAGEDAGEPVASDSPPETDDGLASLVGDKPPMTSLPEPAGPRGAPPAAAQPPAGTSAGSGTPSRAETVSAARPMPPTVARTLDPTGTRRPPAVPRIGPPIQRTAGDSSRPVAARADGPSTSEVGRESGFDAPPSAPDPAPQAAPPVEVVATTEPEVDVAVESLPLVGDRGLIGPPGPGPAANRGPAPAPVVARSPLPGGRAPTPPIGPVASAPRAVTWRPRVGEPSAPVTLGSTPPAAPPSATSRPTVSRHAAGGSAHDHAADEGPDVNRLAVSRLAAAPSKRVPASDSGARAPESDAGTETARETTVAGIRWSDRPAPVPQPWTAGAAVQRSPARPVPTPVRSSANVPAGRAASFPSSPAAAAAAHPLAGRELTFDAAAGTWLDLPIASENVVQRQAEAAPEPAPPGPAPPEPTTVTATAETGPAAPAGAAAGGRKAPTEAEADEWARALYPALRRRICRDLMLDRERSGYSTDIRY